MIKKILLSKTIDNSILCELNPDYYGFEIYKDEDKRRQELLKNRNIKQLCREIKQLCRELMTKTRSSLFIFLIFGSYAKKKQAKNSDIDIMLVSNNKNFEEEISDVLSLLPIKIHFLVFSEEEFIRMKDSKKPNVVKEAIDNNVVLYGIENYYRLKNS